MTTPGLTGIQVKVLQAYGFDEHTVHLSPFGRGLIHQTWKLVSGQGEYILQQVNHRVFREPGLIDENFRVLADYLQAHHPGYLFVAPLPGRDGKTLLHLPGAGYFRLFPFVKGSHSMEVLQTAEQAYEAARQFGRFTRVLGGLDPLLLQSGIPGFHDLSVRYREFEEALENGNKERVGEADELVKQARDFSWILTAFESIRQNPGFKLRVTHHDTKISNVLFDANDRGICVIDLDTVMPGYFISDLGDMMRTYLSPAGEEETNTEQIFIREDFYKAIVDGYCQEMKDELTHTEKGYFFYSGLFMIYMQSLRFLADHLRDDCYYGARYPGHNQNRARNQLVLLQRLLEHQERLGEYGKGA